MNLGLTNFGGFAARFVGLARKKKPPGFRPAVPEDPLFSVVA
ncbi:MAG: hypothetical protein R3D30_11405 [Hyphomicrobiales bacterium]